ncbi:MAG: response regulator [Chloroflexi bacterium]|nr:response regulator [Chloroflexota bacterium]MCL5110956.1 response regulator [Chloroflexota bacterium]
MSRILIVDDEAYILELLDTFLRSEGYETLVASTGREAVEMTLRYQPHLLLLDVMLPDMDGFAVCRRLRGTMRTIYIPIIMLTARQNVGDKVEALAMGADDYLTKPFNLQELLARIRTQLRHVELGLLSELTGLPGNTLIERAVGQLVSGRTQKWAILYVDVDGFKSVNDAYGFVRGNELIKSLARVLREVTDSVGSELTFLGHIGGDDFVVVVPADKAESVCQEIIRRFDRDVTRFYSPEDLARGYILGADRQGRTTRFPIASVSIGVVTNRYKPVDSVGMVGTLAAEVKAKAKSVAGSAYYVDRRR